MADLTNILGGPWSAPQERRPDPPEVQLAAAIEAAGLLLPDKPISLDGRIHRFRSGTKGKPGAGDKSGWYIAFGDGVPAGQFGDWRTGDVHTWRADVGRPLSPSDEVAHAHRMAEARAAREAEQRRMHEAAADVVETIWQQAAPASPDHPYLRRKGIQPNGARITGDGRLVVPLYSADGELSSLQYIGHDGEKRYHPSGATGGMFWPVGSSLSESPGAVYLAEGFATAATVHEATGRPCVAAYSASNLVPVAGAIRELLGPAADIVIIADHDKSGVGQRYAEQASAKYGARFVLPPEFGDVNDFAQAGGDVAALLAQSAPDGLLEKMGVIFGDQLGDDYEAPDELIAGVCTLASLTVIYGDSNSGKTFFALSMAAAVATGRDFYGRRVDQGLAIYLACEAPASVRARLQALKRHYGCSLEDLAIVQVPLNFYESDQHVADVIAMVQEIERVRGKRAHVIFGDTLARMSAGANENSGEDMGPVMARFDRVTKATGAAMVVVHHNGKNAAAGARGWSGIRAHIDTEIEVSEKDGTRIATITKQRELPGKGEAIYFRLEIVEMGVSKFGGVATTCVAVPDDEASAEAPRKKPTQHDERVRTVERAWWASGAEEREGLPYVSRSALVSLLQADGAAKKTAENKVQPSRPDGVVMKLLNAGVLEPHEGGWIIRDKTQASAMLMQKNASK